MNRKLLKFSLVCVTGVIVLAANPQPALAYEEAVAGFTYDKIGNNQDSSTDRSNTISTMATNEIPIPGFSNIGIADVQTNLLIRKGPGENEKILGKLPRHAGCDIIESDDGSGWTKIKSGKVTGYVKTEYLITGSEAAKLALEVGNLIATANTNGLHVRKDPSIDSPIVDQIALGEELLVLDSQIVIYGEEHNKWVQVSLDSGDSADGTISYVSKEYVDLSYALKKAVSIEELEFGTGVSSLRANLVNTAKKYLGNRYVYGGNSLSYGIDCSAFTKAIYAKYGYSIARVSRAQATGGTRISASKLKPGDLVFYGNSSTGYITHVAIYMGNGRIIHASNPRDGIKTSNMYYRQPIKYVRYIND